MVSDDKLRLVQGVYDGYTRGDMPAVMALLGPDLEVHEPASLPFGGTYRGPEGLMRLFGKIAETLGGMRIELERLLADGDVVIAISTLHTVPNGSDTPVRTPLIERWVFRDGKPAELWPYYYDVSGLTRSP